MLNNKEIAKRKAPAHFSPVEKHNRSIIIFLTVCAKNRKQFFANHEFHELIKEAWRQNTEWVIGSYVIMPDHIHLFCAPATTYPTSLKQWVAKWKSHCSRNWLDRGFGKIWQREYWDRQLRKSDSYREKSDYIKMNPVRKGLVASFEDWPYLGTISILIWTD